VRCMGNRAFGLSTKPGVPQESAIWYWPRAMGGIIIEMPVRPGPVVGFVINELEQIFGHAHRAGAKACALFNLKFHPKKPEFPQ